MNDEEYEVEEGPTYPYLEGTEQILRFDTSDWWNRDSRLIEFCLGGDYRLDTRDKAIEAFLTDAELILSTRAAPEWYERTLDGIQMALKFLRYELQIVGDARVYRKG